MGEKLKILFVDDEPDFLETTIKRLARRGYEARSATSCDEALLVLEIGWADVVVLDVMLAGKDGIQCLQEIKRKWPLMTVIMLTGHASMNAGIRGLEFGANDYCMKPIELDELMEKITIAWRETSGSARRQ
jgi:two-component system, OmpR family, response regulator